MEREASDHPLAILVVLGSMFLAMMSLASFFTVFVGAAIAGAIGIACFLNGNVVHLQSVVPRDVMPSPEEVDAVVQRYVDQIETFWEDWKTHQ
jgi:hypothetical protein